MQTHRRERVTMTEDERDAHYELQAAQRKAAERDYHIVDIWRYDRYRRRRGIAEYRHLSTAAARLLRMQWHGRSLEHCYVTVLRTPMEKPCPVPEWRTDMSATAFLALVDAWLTLDHASKQVQRYFSLKHVARASNDQ